jgi:ParB family chromosome partitioning protein
MEKAQNQRRDGLALGKIGNLSDMMSATKGKKAESVLERLDMHVVEEDPNNPRKVYDPAKMRELAQTIKERKDLLSPISVRENPEKPGFYIINHGHRRFRASKMARKQKILAFIDNTFTDDLDQLIDNIQREDLPMMDVANSIGRALSRGMKQKDIAEKIGKSTGYVSQYAKLLDLPEAVSRAVLNNQITDVIVAYDLINLEKKHPEEVMAFVQKEPEITRQVLTVLKRSLNGDTEKAEKPKPAPAPASSADADERGDNIEPLETTTPPTPTDEAGEQDDNTKTPAKDTPESGEPVAIPERMKKPVLTVMKGKQKAFLVLDRKPKSPKHIWIRFENELRGVVEVPIRSLSLFEVNEG